MYSHLSNKRGRWNKQGGGQIFFITSNMQGGGAIFFITSNSAWRGTKPEKTISETPCLLDG